MTKFRYSHDQIASVLVEVKVQRCYRIIEKVNLSKPLGSEPSNSRFSSHEGNYAVLYAASEFSTAFIETVVRDRFVKTSRQREINLSQILDRVCVSIATKSEHSLRLLDLREDGCLRARVPTDTVNARSHSAGRALGNFVNLNCSDVDGFLYSSRLTAKDNYAIFDRAVEKFEIIQSEDLEINACVPGILVRHNIALIKKI